MIVEEYNIDRAYRIIHNVFDVLAGMPFSTEEFLGEEAYKEAMKWMAEYRNEEYEGDDEEED